MNEKISIPFVNCRNFKQYLSGECFDTHWAKVLVGDVGNLNLIIFAYFFTPILYGLLFTTQT